MILTGGSPPSSTLLSVRSVPDDLLRRLPVSPAKKAPTPDRLAFGQALRAARSSAGLAQLDVAIALGLGGDRSSGQTTVANWERGISVPSIEQVFALEKLFKTKPGAMSKFLGFLPTGAVRTVCDVKTAIVEDPGLDDESRDILLRAYAKLATPGSRRGRPRRA